MKLVKHKDSGEIILKIKGYTKIPSVLISILHLKHLLDPISPHNASQNIQEDGNEVQLISSDFGEFSFQGNHI